MRDRSFRAGGCSRTSILPSGPIPPSHPEPCQQPHETQQLGGHPWNTPRIVGRTRQSPRGSARWTCDVRGHHLRGRLPPAARRTGLRRPGAWPGADRGRAHRRRDRHAHSLHGYFLRAGRRLQAHPIRSGGAARRRLVQRPSHPRDPGRRADPVDDRLVPGRPGRTGARGDDARGSRRRTRCRLASTCSAPSRPPDADFWLNQAPFDVRHVEGSLFIEPDPRPKQYQTAWMRVRRPIEAYSNLLHRALIAFGCDQVMLEPLMRRHGASWATKNFGVREPRPRDVVAPPRARRRVAAVRAGHPHRPGRARPHGRVGVRRGRPPGGNHRPGGHDPLAR